MGKKIQSLRLRLIEARLETILSNQRSIMATLKDLQDQVTALQASVAKDTDVVSSAVTLLGGLKKSLDDALALNNPTDIVTAVTALRDTLDKNTQGLSDAVAANTPAAP